jgi:predicted dehydrogenase
MTKTGKQFISNFIANSIRFGYLPDEDRHFLKHETPEYRFNIIGAGIMGQEHMNVTMQEGRATIHGVYDPNTSSAKQLQKLFARYQTGAELVEYDSLEAACNDPEVDGLIIATPNYTHYEVVSVAARSGKHILLEKPMATTLQDAYKIKEIAENHNAVFQVGLQYRYKAIYVEAIHEALERNSLGNIKTVNMVEHRPPFLDKVKQWNKFAKYSGGTLVEKCCHYFDLMNLFAQSKPVSVYAAGSMAANFLDFSYKNEKSDILDNAQVTVIYENGVIASFNLCMFSPQTYEELVICGDEGRLKASENTDHLKTARPDNHIEIMRGELNPSRVSIPAYPSYIESSGHSGATFYEHIYFVDNIAGEMTGTATADDGFWSVIVGAAAEESVKTGAIVKIDELLMANDIKIEP